jgi:hypothetical protein
VIIPLRAARLRVSIVLGTAEEFQSVDAPADLVMAKLRFATGARDPAELCDWQRIWRTLAFFRSYGMPMPTDASRTDPRVPASLLDLAASAVASVRALVGPVLDLTGDT